MLMRAMATVNFDELKFPATYLVDYVRIWQPEDEINIGCDRELSSFSL